MAVYKDYLKVNNTQMKVPYIDIVCKYCGSRNVIKYGHYRGVQRFYCKDCKRKFADNDALPNMQTPIEQIGSAVSMFYEGQSLNSITPAQAAGVKYPYRNWQDIVARKRVDTVSQANATSVTQIPELPEGVEYVILRRRIAKRPKRTRRKDKPITTLSGVRS